ncbi:MAG: hypothetical protein HGA19_23090 [Oscillochloris sp.]|nr:hypothetical protein [Oscillochloris sp.]
MDREIRPITGAPPWPELARSEPRQRQPFPMLLFLSWLLPGLLIGFGMLGFYAVLSQRAARQIVYLNPSGQPDVVRADGATDPNFKLRINTSSRLQGLQWSPRGGQFASIITNTYGIATVLLASTGEITPTTISLLNAQRPFLPRAAWAPSGGTLAVVDANTVRIAALQLVDVAKKRAIAIPASLNPSAPVHWHPQRDELMVTILAEESPSDLAIITPDGRQQAFVPQDEQIGRKEGVWSPDGQRVAYIGVSSDGTTQPLIVAQADGRNPQVIETLLLGARRMELIAQRMLEGLEASHPVIDKPKQAEAKRCKVESCYLRVYMTPSAKVGSGGKI